MSFTYFTTQTKAHILIYANFHSYPLGFQMAIEQPPPNCQVQLDNATLSAWSVIEMTG